LWSDSRRVATAQSTDFFDAAPPLSYVEFRFLKSGPSQGLGGADQALGKQQCAAEGKVGYAQSWLGRLIDRRHPNVAAVALANKNARIVWALLKHERDYQPGYPPSAAWTHVTARPDLTNWDKEELSTDCSGNQDVMARKVRPWQVKPFSHRERKAREADQEPASIFHQGHRHRRTKVRMYGCNLYLLVVMRLSAWQTAGDHVCVKTPMPIRESSLLSNFFEKISQKRAYDRQ
jgi:hypothetical protein